MDIIGVVDLLDGIVVHGKAGKRDEYRALKSKVIKGDTADPYDVVKGFWNDINLKKIYIADLNAITARGDNFNIISGLVNDFPEIDFILDAGVSNLKDFYTVNSLGVDKVIIGSETLNNLNFLYKLADKKSEIVFSLDLNDGKAKTAIKDKDINIDELLVLLQNLNIKDVILLNIDNVGLSSGIGDKIYKIRSKYPYFNFITGGGIRNYRDLKRLQKNNFNGALLATSLHNKKIVKDDINRLKKPGLAWGITGCGHFLPEIVDVINKLKDICTIDIYLSKAGAEILKMYDIEFKSCNVYYDRMASSPQVGRFYNYYYDLLIIGPTTSNTVAKMVTGISDNLITNIFAQAGKTKLPIIVLPGDNESMLETKAPGKENNFIVYPRDIDLTNTEILKKFSGVKTVESPEEVFLWIKKYLSQVNWPASL